MFRVFAEFVLMLVIPIIGVTQLVWPLWKGQPIFPSFRRRKIVRDLSGAREEVEVARMERELEEIKKSAEVLRATVKVIEKETENDG